MTAAESVALAGKMWLAEDDTRTYLGSGSFPGQFDGATNLVDTQTLLRRNLAEEATRNFSTWWMDLGMTGWFNDARMWEEMKSFEAVDRIFLEKPLAYQPEVAAVIDEFSMLETSANAWPVTERIIYQVRRPLARMGAPYGQYLLDDVLKGRVHPKLFVFLNAWQLSEKQRQALRRETRGTCRIWCYAPGYHAGNQSSLEAMRELTGFRLETVAAPRTWATPTESGKQLGLQTPFGIESAVLPLFAATDVSPEETLATYPDGSAAIALRRLSDGWSLFVGAPGLSSELLRVAAKKAGVHLYTETDCNVYANGPIVGLHAAQDGPIRLDAGRKSAIYDALSGKLLGNGPEISLPMNRGDTRVLRLAK